MVLNSLQRGQYGNLYLNLAQSAYAGQPVSLARWLTKRPVRIDYARARVHHGPQHQRLGRTGDPAAYLQPDLLAVNQGESGLQAYVLTDQPDAASMTCAYFVVRGTESLRLRDPDWWQNNLPFAFNHRVPAQASAALLAWRTAAAHLPDGVTWDFCGHSLGTMVIIGLLAQMTATELARVGRAVLFNGPDMAGVLDTAQRQRLQAITLQGRLDYYLASHDLVSAFGRSTVSGIGRCHYIEAPTNRATMPSIAAHAFDQYMVDRSGKIAEDNSTENLAYAQRLAAGLDRGLAEVSASGAAITTYALRLATFLGKETN